MDKLDHNSVSSDAETTETPKQAATDANSLPIPAAEQTDTDAPTSPAQAPTNADAAANTETPQPPPEFVIRPLAREDREWVAHFLDAHWGSTQVVSRGEAYYGHLLPGFVAERYTPGVHDMPHTDTHTEAMTGHAPAQKQGKGKHTPADVPTAKRLGLITYHIDGDECEILTLDSLEENKGVGTALLNEVRTAMKTHQPRIRRIWLITTNDNLTALRFWQKREFVLVTIHRDAIQQARRIKPQIAIVGQHGIPIRDEIELEYRLR